MGNYTAPAPNSGQGNFRNYSLGPVKPWVQFAGNQIGTMFEVDTEYGFSNRDHGVDAGHWLGLAIDFMVYGDAQKGDAIAAYAQQTYKQLNIYYIIWQQRIWDYKRDDPGLPHDQWRLMGDRGDATANHMDHVHISFNANADTGKTYKGFKNHDPAEDLPWNKAIGGIGNLKDLIGWLGNGHNWFRIFLILAGGIMIGFSLVKLSKGTPAAGIAQVVTKSKALTQTKAVT